MVSVCDEGEASRAFMGRKLSRKTMRIDRIGMAEDEQFLVSRN
jgi:hypothetical protein